MNLLEIRVKNYRSLEDEIFKVEEISGGKTFTLIGINESGKTSFLRAVSLFGGDDVVYPRDFFDENQPIDICLTYELNEQEKKALIKHFIDKGFPKEITNKISITKVEVGATFEPTIVTSTENYESITFTQTLFPEYTPSSTGVIKNTGQPSEPTFDLQEYFEKHLSAHFLEMAHETSFWKSDSKHLITDQINLDLFAANPQDISVPLYNCFKLAGIENITKEITNIKTDPARISNLQEKLGDKVTEHIKKVWPDHPIKIKFQINNMFLSFLIEDEKVKYKSKTPEQRSDGFKQFVSFLLTVSAENSTSRLSNTLLLIDEPETHLHPTAQENLKDELIRLTTNKENNIVIFATHSNYMIDKEHMDRCYRVIKQGNNKTKFERIKSLNSSYAEVNYEVFDILSTDYHNELYGYLEDVDVTKLTSLPIAKQWINTKRNITEDVSLSKYIRNAIHHPENTRNVKFTNSELDESIKTLRALKYPKSIAKPAIAKKVAQVA